MEQGGIGAWIKAPFLKEVNGRQLFELLGAIKEKGLYGSMECALNRGKGGVVEMLHFEGGLPLEDRQKVGALVQQDDIVLAWMPAHAPGASGAKADPDATNPTEPLHCGLNAEQVDALKKMLQEFLMYGDKHEWAAILHNTDVAVSCSLDTESLGISAFSGLIAEMNSSFLDFMDGHPVQRLVVGFKGTRVGFDALGSAYTLVYRINPTQQSNQAATAEALQAALTEWGLATAEVNYEMSASEARSFSSRYMHIMPEKHLGALSVFSKAIARTEVNWAELWYRYKGNYTGHYTRAGEYDQLHGGGMGELAELIGTAFASFVGQVPKDVVVHTTNGTLWLYFPTPASMVALRFEGVRGVWKKHADAAAQVLYRALRMTFGPLSNE